MAILEDFGLTIESYEVKQYGLSKPRLTKREVDIGLQEIYNTLNNHEIRITNLENP